MRRTPVVPLPADLDPQWAAMLQRCLGFLHPLAVVPLVLDAAGLATTPAGGGTAIVASRHVIDWTDTGCDEWRLVGYGVDAAAVAADIAYSVNGVELARADIPQTAAAAFAGPWTRIPASDWATIAGDQTGEAIGYGNGAATITWYHLVVQGRTVSRTW